MEKRMNKRSAVCCPAVRALSMSRRLNSAVPFMNALRFFFYAFFAFIYPCFPICKRCS